MNIQKIGVVLLALLLAAMAIVPCVSAADTDVNAETRNADLADAVTKIATGQISAGTDEPVVLLQEVVVTGPLSPVQPGNMKTGADMDNSVPWGATIEHMIVDSIPVTIVYDKDGNVRFWADDSKAQTVLTFKNSYAAATRVHDIPAGSVINHVNPELTVVSDPDTKETILKIKDHTDEKRQSSANNSLVGICRESNGCYIADIYGSDTFNSMPFDKSLDYHPFFSRTYDDEADETTMTICKATPADPYKCTGASPSTGLSVSISSENTDSQKASGITRSVSSAIEMPCGWIGVMPSISSSGMAVTFGSWINWVWYPLAGVPTVDVDFRNQLIRDYGSGYTQLISSGQHKYYSGVGLVGVSDSNTYTVSSAGDYFTLTSMTWEVPPSATCIPASGSGLFQTSPNLAVP
jgi:hypothetical protein